ncbi:hypothetical protein [Leifsonia xyli]
MIGFVGAIGFSGFSKVPSQRIRSASRRAAASASYSSFDLAAAA